MSDRHIEALKERNKSNVILMGDIQYGIIEVVFLAHFLQGATRHRAILYKYLADCLELDVTLFKSLRRSRSKDQADFFVHCYNTVQLQSRNLVVDLMWDCSQLYVEDSDLAKLYIEWKDSANVPLLPLPDNNTRSTCKRMFRWMRPADFGTSEIQRVEVLGKGVCT